MAAIACVPATAVPDADGRFDDGVDENVDANGNADIRLNAKLDAKLNAKLNAKVDANSTVARRPSAPAAPSVSLARAVSKKAGASRTSRTSCDHHSPRKQQNNPEVETSVCVIGAGPGGMFFAFHMDDRIRQLRRSGKFKGTAFRIQCFERASGPGGVWRKADANDTSNNHCVEMYDNLWTNGASHNMEFQDYTFDEHFDGWPVSVYLQRKDVLDYMLARVTRRNPNLFQQYMRFNTEVQHVTFDESAQKFTVRTVHLPTGRRQTQQFDYCIWCAGNNGRQKMPQTTVHRLRAGGFAGPVLHSADTARLEETVRGKRILLVGGSYSAEDLAIQAIKLGVQHVDVVARSGESNVVWVKNWPGHKVSIHTGKQILKAEGSTVHLEAVKWSWPSNYSGLGISEQTIPDIDAVLFCTGYEPAFQMLDPKLLVPSKDVPLKVPDDWKMDENDFTEYLGDVKPSTECYYSSWHCPGLYHGVVIDNPRMMYFQDLTSSPMMDHDAFAWLFAGHVSGLLQLPSREDMRKHNLDRALTEMQMPNYRIYMDVAYDNVIGNVPGLFPADSSISAAWSKEISKGMPYSVKLLADIMRAGSYPVSLGTYERLNEAGERIVQHEVLSSSHRYADTTAENASEDHAEWTTFRDTTDADRFQSIFTGTKAVNLQKRWLGM